MKTDNFVIKNFKNAKTALFTTSLTDFNNFLKVFKEKKIEFIPRTPKEEKIYSAILRDVSNDFSENEVLSEIQALGLDGDNIYKVKKINLKEFFGAAKGGDAFLVQVTDLKGFKVLTNIECIANQSIRWDKIY